MKALEHILEVFMFNSRWLLAPFYVGLILAIGLLMVTLFQRVSASCAHFPFSRAGAGDRAGNSVTHRSGAGGQSDADHRIRRIRKFCISYRCGGSQRQTGMDGQGGIHRPQDQADRFHRCHFGYRTAEAVRHISEGVSQQELIWKVSIHITLVVSGVLFALMGRIGGKTPH